MKQKSVYAPIIIDEKHFPLVFFRVTDLFQSFQNVF